MTLIGRVKKPHQKLLAVTHSNIKGTGENTVSIHTCMYTYVPMGLGLGSSQDTSKMSVQPDWPPWHCL